MLCDAAQVIAASALIINEAQQLIEVAEPAWQYDTYNMIWEVMAKDQQLESRIKALEVKVCVGRGVQLHLASIQHVGDREREYAHQQLVTHQGTGSQGVCEQRQAAGSSCHFLALDHHSCVSSVFWCTTGTSHSCTAGTHQASLWHACCVYGGAAHGEAPPCCTQGLTPALHSALPMSCVQLHQVEAEAKHDVKARAGRRSLLLEQGIILLLTISCMLVAMEVGVKLSKLVGADGSNNSQEDTGSSRSGSSEAHSWDGDPAEKLVAVGPR